jgi:hypothetical protein
MLDLAVEVRRYICRQLFPDLLAEVLRKLKQYSSQAVQPRPGPLGLAWLAGLVGLVLAPSRLGRRIDGSESWTQYGQGHGGCELYPFGHSLHYIG